MLRKRANILGIAVDVINLQETIDRIEKSVRASKHHYVCVVSTQDTIIAHKDENLKLIINHADLVLPDGWPVVWAMRANGFRQEGRVTGPDLMLALCEYGTKLGLSHFFYGGQKGVSQLLSKKLTERFPGLKTGGTYSSPFRPLSPEEDEKIISLINDSDADILWIGLGALKQHFWIYEHLNKVNTPVMIGVGAAFDFNSGRLKRAPTWMQHYGLEWFHRLCQEPRRLWKRYLECLHKFPLKLLGQLLGIKKYNIDTSK